MHSEKVSTATSTSSSSENRKNSKPIMEKRRRARMNASLTELKSLLLEVMKKEGNRHNKMEKADILEMTVKQLRLLQRQHFSASTNEESPVLPKYVLGFQECASEVSRYMTSIAEVDTEIRTRLLNHLATYITSSPSVSNASSPNHNSSSSSSPPLPTPPASRPSSESENSFCPSPDTATTASPPPSRHVFPTKSPASPTESVIPNETSSPTESKHTATTPTPTTANVTGVTNGILTLDPSFSQHQVSKLGGFQLVTTKMPTCQVAFVLPASVMTDNSQKTFQAPQGYMPFPIYAPSSQGSFTPFTSSMPSTGGMMTLMPDMSKSGVNVAPMTNMQGVPQLISFPGTLSSPLSSGGAQILVNGTDFYKQFEHPQANSPQMSPPEIKKSFSPPPPPPTSHYVTKELSRSHIAVHEEPSNLRVSEDENVWRPW